MVILVAKYRGKTKTEMLQKKIDFRYQCHDLFTQSLWDFFIETFLFEFWPFRCFIDFQIPKVGAKLFLKSDGVYQVKLNRNFWKRVDMFRRLNEYSGNGLKILRMTASKALAVLLHCNFCKSSDMFLCSCNLEPLDDLVVIIGKTVYQVNQESQVPNLHTFRARSLISGNASDNGYNLSFSDYFCEPVDNRNLHVYELAK